MQIFKRLSFAVEISVLKEIAVKVLRTEILPAVSILPSCEWGRKCIKSLKLKASEYVEHILFFQYFFQLKKISGAYCTPATGDNNWANLF